MLVADSVDRHQWRSSASYLSANIDSQTFQSEVEAHLEKIGAKLTELSKEQADYIGVTVKGPYKPEHYRY